MAKYAERIRRKKCIIKDDEIGPDFMKTAYRDGHKRCKNESAKIAAEADAEIERLESILSNAWCVLQALGNKSLDKEIRQALKGENHD